MIGQGLLIKPKKDELVAKLSLISLMDIFTILVFFLMLNSGETQTIETVKVVDLPNSSSSKSPHTDLTLFVSQEHVIFDKAEIIELSEIRKTPKQPIEALRTVLQEQKVKLGKNDIRAQEKIGHAITIQADKHVDYEILKAIMETCQIENFRNISLAVNSSKDIPLSSPAASIPVASLAELKGGEG